MAALLFVGKIIRAKFGFIQKLYIPSALIAGFLGLILGHQFLNIIPFSNEIPIIIPPSNPMVAKV